MDRHTSSLSLPPGTRVREFKIGHCLGEGSFGIVYGAIHEILGERVAIKEFLPRDLAHRIDGIRVAALPGKAGEYAWAREKFLREARTLKALAEPHPHPRLVQVLHAFPENDTVYMCMRYEEGMSLEAILRQDGSLSEARLKDLLMPLLDGLEHAHAHDVWHRDIKPSNILVRADGSAVLIDFGAARHDTGGTDRSIMAQCTPGYASPEQLWSVEEQGPWTDVYGLGATLYRAIVGKPPSGFSPTHLRDDFRNRYSETFLAAVDMALAPKPQDRPQTMREWRERFQFAAPPSAATLAATELPTVTRPVPGGQEDATRILAPPPSAPPGRPVTSDAPPAKTVRAHFWRWTLPALVAAIATAAGIWLWSADHRFFADTPERKATPLTPSGLVADSRISENPHTTDLAAIEALLGTLECARLTASLTSDRVLTLSGYLSRADDLWSLRPRLLAIAPDAQIHADAVEIRPLPFCQALAALDERLAMAAPDIPAPEIQLNQPAAAYRAGEFLVATVLSNNPRSGYLYLDYVDVGGEVVHLLPTLAEPDNRISPGGQVVIGAEDEAACRQRECYEIAPPHGKSLLIAVWSHRPLSSHPRTRLTESAQEYVSALVDAIGHAEAGTPPEVAFAYRFLVTQP